MASVVQLTVPERAPSHGPIPCEVTISADEATFVANRGVLDAALSVVFVRRDAPGVRFLPTMDPAALLYPEPPLPPPPPLPPDVDPMAVAPSTFSETRTLDPLDYGASHDGHAAWWVFAAFARHHTPVHSLLVNDMRGPLGPMPARRLPPLPSDARITIFPLPVNPGAVARVVLRDGAPAIEGAFLCAPLPPSIHPTVPFVTLVAIRLETTGGVAAATFVLDPLPAGSPPHGRFSVPIHLLAPQLAGGIVRVLVFAGDECADPVDIVLPDA